MHMVCHVDKYKITVKLVINWTNEILQNIVISSGDLAVEKHCSTLLRRSVSECSGVRAKS